MLGALLLFGFASETGCFTKENNINGNPPGGEAPPADGSITSAGGEIADAALGAKLSIDPGTLAADESVRFTISEARPPATPALPATLEAVTRYVSFQPSDRTFARDLRLSIEVPGGDHRLYRLVGSEWKVEASATFTGAQAKLSTTRLGVFVVAKNAPPPGGEGGKGGVAGQTTGGSAGAAGAPPEECTGDQIGCLDGLPWTCSAAGQRVLGKACGGGEQCKDGLCAPPTVQGGAGGEPSGGSAGSGGAESAGTGGVAGSSGSGGTEATGGNGGAAGGTSGSGGASAGGGNGGSGQGGTESGGSAGSGGSAPACELPDLVCGGTCVAVKTSQTHCGKCDNACGADQTCTNGACACNGAATLCGSICVDTLVNASHCGACGNVCDPGVACQAGHCVSEWALWRLPGELGAPFSYERLAGDQIVLDKVTTLQWQRNPSTTKREWQAAVAHCEDLVLAGFSDWRAPTAVELMSLVDFTTSSPAIDKVQFPNTPSARFWTSSPAPKDPSQAWFVEFSRGESYGANVGEANYVRCVR